MEEMGDREFEKAQLLVSLLYTRNIFSDFRRPVLASYPEIAKSYLDIVEDPMDLGTLFLKIHSRRLTVDDLRKNLQLIANNALQFNEGCGWLESLIKHLAHTSEGLFEEIFRVPYFPQNNVNTSIEFELELRNKRSARFALVGERHMNINEMEFLRTLLHSVERTESIPDKCKTAVKSVCKELQNNIDEAHPDEEYGIKVVKDLCMKEVVRKLLDFVVEVPSSSNASENHVLFSLIDSFYPQHIVSEMNTDYLTIVEEVLGILAVLIEERTLRGSSLSTTWATPYPELIWVQLPKDGKGRQLYWPCMIVVSNSPVFPMSKEVMRKNVERLPDEIVRGLIKLRPRFNPNKHETDTPASPEPQAPTPSETQENGIWLTAKKIVEERVRADRAPPATSAVCPEGYLIIEYFGDHDVGWMKADATLKMEAPGNYPAPLNKIANSKVLDEASQARVLLERRYRFKAEATDEDRDLATMPDISDLEHSILISDTLKTLINKAADKTPKKSPAPKKKTAPATKEVVNEESVNEPLNEAGNSAKKRSIKLKVGDIVDVNGVVLNNIPTPSKLRPQEYKVNYNRGIVGDKFVPSKCPLPVQVQADFVVPGFHTKNGLNYRRNAVIRSRCYAHYLQQIRPQSFTEVESTPSTITDVTPAVGEPDRNEFKLEIELDKPKRKYFRKTDFSVGTTNNEGKFSILECGSTRYSFGKGLIYASKINFEDPIFFRESRDRTERLRLLESELERIKRGVDDLKILTSAPESVRPTSENASEEYKKYPKDHVETSPSQSQSTSGTKPFMHAKKSSPQQPICALQSLANSTFVAKATEVLPGKVGLIAKFQNEKRERESLGSSSQVHIKKAKTSLDPTSVNDMMPVL